MQFLTPKQKRDKSRQLFLGYGLFGLLIALATYVMVSTALGYEIFTTKGEIVQNGLLFVDSKPTGADIYVNGEKESSGTNAKLSLPEGTYEIKLQKKGFREWSQDVDLFGGSVEFLTYPRLLPSVINKLSSTSYAGMENTVLQSRDNRWLVQYSLTDPLMLHLHDIDNPTADVSAINIPPSLVGESQIVSFELVEWAGDNVHFLVRINLSNSTSRLTIFNREKLDEIFDASTTLGLVGNTQANFWDGKWDQLVLVDTGGVVRLASVKDKTIDPTPLITENVKEFFPLSDKRAVYTVINLDGTNTVRILTNEKTYRLLSYPSTDKKLLVKGGGFNRNDYLILSGGGLEKALLYRNIFDLISKPTVEKVSPFVTMPVNASTIGFSRSNRFVLASNNSDSAVYDIEQKELIKYKNPVQDVSTIGWFDDSRLFGLAKDRSVSIYDFNGNNLYEMTQNSSSIPYVNQSIEKVANIQNNSGSQVLQILDIISESK